MFEEFTEQDPQPNELVDADYGDSRVRLRFADLNPLYEWHEITGITDLPIRVFARGREVDDRPSLEELCGRHDLGDELAPCSCKRCEGGKW